MSPSSEPLARIPELLTLADQHEQVKRLRSTETLGEDDDLARIELALRQRFWSLAYAIAAKLPRIG